MFLCGVVLSVCNQLLSLMKLNAGTVVASENKLSKARAKSSTPVRFRSRLESDNSSQAAAIQNLNSELESKARQLDATVSEARNVEHNLRSQLQSQQQESNLRQQHLLQQLEAQESRLIQEKSEFESRLAALTGTVASLEQQLAIQNDSVVNLNGELARRTKKLEEVQRHFRFVMLLPLVVFSFSSLAMEKDLSYFYCYLLMHGSDL